MYWPRLGVAGLLCAIGLSSQTAQPNNRASQIQAARDLADRGSAQNLQQALGASTRIAVEAKAAADASSEADALYLTGVIQLRLGRFPEAVTTYQDAIALYRKLGNQRRLGTALNDLGLATSRRGDQTAALAALTEALELQNKDSDPGDRAATLNNLGLVYNELGDPARSRAYLEQTLAIRRQLGDRGPEGAALSNLGALYYLEGDMQKALDEWLEAIQLRKAAGDRRGAASTLSKVGLVYTVLNRPDQALRCFEEALAGIREAGDQHEEADVLSHMGGAWRELGDSGKALSFYQQSLKLQRESGKQTSIANDLANTAMVYRDQGQFEKALALLKEALQVDESIHEQRDAGSILQRIGAIDRLRGNSTEALDYLSRALAIARQLHEKQLEAATLYETGMTHAQLHDWRSALADAESAIRLTENIRGGVASFEMRASYVASIRGQYELAIDSLMQLRQADRAIEMAERSRARSLLDLLSESHGGMTGAGDPALQQKAHALEASLGVLGGRLLRMPAGSPQRKAAEEKLQTTSADLDQVRAEIRAKDPAYAALTQPEPVSLHQIQSLLGPDTVFLEFSLGSPRSYIWLVTPDSTEGHELPNRAVIQSAARKLHEAWSRNEPADGHELSNLLFAGIAAKLGRSRLVIAAEGALEYVPFAALPVPGSMNRILIDEHEVVNVPSASTMAVLRHDAALRKRAPNAVAVFADPVFSASDLRVTSASEGRGESFERLPGTRKEAQQIIALAGANRSFEALDFSANRSAVLSAQLRDYRIVHFATHGILDSRHPELSGLVLSMVSPAGKPVDGFLQTHDVYNMKLRADLVVLSACQTALGTEIAGEGLVGLTRGFMYAGAPRVVASLWRVPDSPTSELMRQFYENMLTRGVAPAAALRQSALAMRREPKWASPYYWAAFVLQGEWN